MKCHMNWMVMRGSGVFTILFLIVFVLAPGLLAFSPGAMAADEGH